MADTTQTNPTGTYIDKSGTPVNLPGSPEEQNLAANKAGYDWKPATSSPGPASTMDVNKLPPGSVTSVTDSSAVRRDITAAGGASAVPPDALKAPTYEEFKAQMGDTNNPPPTAPNTLDQYAQMRADQGIPALEDTIGQYDAQKADLMSQLAEFKRGSTAGYSEATGVARISEAERNVQDKLDFIGRQESLAQNKLTIKNNYIQSLMQYSKDDYATARQNYEYEFNKNIQMQNAYSTAMNREMTLDEKQKNDARATLTSMWNMASKSVAKDPAGLEKYLKDNGSSINQLELMAGEPVGSTEAFLRSVPNATILGKTKSYDSNGQEFISYQHVDPDTGEMLNTRVYTGGVAQKTVASAGTSSSGVTKTTYKKMEVAGVPSNIATKITSLLDSGKTGDQIQKMLTDAGLDPSMYDIYKNTISPPKKSASRFGSTQ